MFISYICKTFELDTHESPNISQILPITRVNLI